MSEISKIRVGISVGDPNGIGFEIILKTFEDKRIFDFFTPIVFAHSKNFIEERKKLGCTTSVFTLKNIKNPNKVFALLRTFSANHVHFHRSDGFGYHLISEAILELDAINPQVAARISRSFDRWQKFDKARQSHAKSAMETIINQPKLSKDTGEIISKTLRG